MMNPRKLSLLDRLLRGRQSPNHPSSEAVSKPGDTLLSDVSGSCSPPPECDLSAQVAPAPHLMMFPPYDKTLETYITADDPVRYASVLLALHTIQSDQVPGSCAELGVYRGDMSLVIHVACPDRSLYLFDTFEGFPAKDLQGVDDRFKDTSVDLVLERLGDRRNVVIRKGYFPDTADGLENERFAFVMLDVDLYAPTLAGLHFFYPRLVPGGYLFAHDYNSPESNWAVSRAVDEFFRDRAEKPIAIPDKWGSVVIRKV